MSEKTASILRTKIWYKQKIVYKNLEKHLRYYICYTFINIMWILNQMSSYEDINCRQISKWIKICGLKLKVFVAAEESDAAAA